MIPGRLSVRTALFTALAAALLPLRSGVADAPKGHFMVKGDVVVDTRTKLTWQRGVPQKTFSSDSALNFCAGLDLDGTGWRMPTIKELHTLVDETRTLPAIDEQAFPDTPPGFFWTASRLAKFPQYVWSVNFAEGTDAWFPGENPQRIRCVR